MRRVIWPMVLLIAVSAIAAGTVIPALSEAQERPAAKTIKPGDRWAGRPGTPQPPEVEAPVIETVKLTYDTGGNWRYPGVAEDSKGNRLAIFRGPDLLYWYTFYKKGGTWSTPALIPNQPSLNGNFFADIEVDSTDRFHCIWEENKNAAVYASFRDGEGWTTPYQQQRAGYYDLVTAIDVRSNDEVLTVDSERVGLSKDIYLHTKGKDQSQFSYPINLTKDYEGSTQPWLAVDSKDHVWVVHKSDYPYNPDPTQDILVIYLSHWDQNNKEVMIDPVEIWQIVSDTTGWSFLPQVAVNNEDKVMTAWAFATGNDYITRLYDPATKKLSPQIPVNIGLSRNPWHTFWLKLAAHGKDFYLAVINPARILYLFKFDETTSKWTQVAQVSDRSVDLFDLYSGYDRMLVAWGSWEEPTNVYLTTVEVSGITSQKPTLTIQASAGGTTDPVPGSYRYDKGSRVTIRAVPDEGYRLSSWSGDASGNATSITVTMDRNLTIMADFASIPIPKPPLDPVLETGLEASQTTKINTLTWQRNPGNAGLELKEYWIYRKRANMSDSDFTKIGSVPWETLQYMDRGLPLNQKFTYGLTASPLDPYGKESARSESVTEISTFPPLSAACKTVVNYSLFRKEKINRISWQANPLNDAVTIAQYNIYRKRNDQEDSAYKLIASVAGSVVEYLDRKLPFSESYVYVIRAVDSGGYESGISNPARE